VHYRQPTPANPLPLDATQLGLPAEASRDVAQLGSIAFGPDLRDGIDFLIKEIVHDESYRRHGIEFQEDATIFDIGAHIGLFALYAHLKCRGRLSLYCFEPIPETYYFLHKNLASRQLLDHGTARLFNLGVAERGAPAQAEFLHFPHASLLSTMKPAEFKEQFQRWEQFLKFRVALRFFKQQSPRLFPLYWAAYTVAYPFIRRSLRRKLNLLGEARPVSCRLTTVSDICREHRVAVIDLLKIDAEGCEWEILNGIDDVDWPRIRQIVMEANDVGGRVTAIERKLREKGFAHVVVEQPDWSATSLSDAVYVYARS
jgi:FkbM family methyltransferase